MKFNKILDFLIINILFLTQIIVEVAEVQKVAVVILAMTSNRHTLIKIGKCPRGSPLLQLREEKLNFSPENGHGSNANVSLIHCLSQIWLDLNTTSHFLGSLKI